MTADIETIDAQSAVKLLVDELTKTGWTLDDESSESMAVLHYDNGMDMMISFVPGSAVPFRFIFGLKVPEGPMQFCIDFGDQFATLVSIMAEYGPQTTSDNFRGVIAALAKLLPAVYFLEDGKTLRQLDLVGWE